MRIFFLHLKNGNDCWCQYSSHLGQKRLRQVNEEMQWLAFAQKSPCNVVCILSWNNLMDINSITVVQIYFLILPFLVYTYAY